jgi:hypothetical protein
MKKIIYQIIKGRLKVVNLDNFSDHSGLLSALSKHAMILIKACFNNGGSLVHLTIFKQFIVHI